MQETKTRTAPGEVLAIVSAGVVLASLDLFVVNVALPQIARDLGQANLGELSWVLNGYAIVYASLLVFFGRLADRYRRDRGFLLGVAIFTAASAACAAATSVGMLVGFRLVQAAGAALLTPTSLGLILATYEPDRRPGAVRAWTATSGVAAALGPVVGGLLVTASWRWVFLINVPIGIVALIAGWRRLPHVSGHATERPDPLGVVLATAGVAVLTFALVKGSDWGWGSASVTGTLAAAAVLLTLFVAHCARAGNPLIHPSLFRSRSFTGASLIAIFFSVAFGAMLLSIVLWEQGAWGWSALRAGLAIAPGPLMVPLVSFGVAGRLIARYGPAPVITLGGLAFAGGVAWWAIAMQAHPDYLAGGLGGMLLTGAGVGLTLPTMMATASSSLPPQSFATGSAVINMLRQTGLALGVAILVAVLGTSAARGGAALTAFRHGWWVIAAISLASAVPAVALLRPRRATALRRRPAQARALEAVHGLGPVPCVLALVPRVLALVPRVLARGQGQRLDRAVEPVPARAPDPRALHRAVRRAHRVPAFHLGRKAAADRAGLVHVGRAVKKHHAVVHRSLPPSYKALPGGPATTRQYWARPRIPLLTARAPSWSQRAGPRR